MQEDWKPKLDMVFDTIEDAWKFWVDYGGRVGFGVRKQYAHKNKKDGSITSYKFVCCKEGFRRVFIHMDVKSVPEHYILKRWTKFARSGPSLNVGVSHVVENVDLSPTQRYKSICPRLIRIASEACRSEETFTFLCKVANELDSHILQFQNNQVSTAQVNEFVSTFKENASINDGSTQVKGFKKKEGKNSSKRMKSCLEGQGTNTTVNDTHYRPSMVIHECDDTLSQFAGISFTRLLMESSHEDITSVTKP